MTRVWCSISEVLKAYNFGSMLCILPVSQRSSVLPAVFPRKQSVPPAWTHVIIIVILTAPLLLIQIRQSAASRPFLSFLV